MTTLEFLSYLWDQDIRVQVDGDRLRLSAPAGRLTQELRAQIVRRKAEILSFLQTAAIDPLSLHPVSRDGILPLSISQERMWFLDQLEPGNPAYNTNMAFRLNGSLDVAILEQSLNEIIRRHESLRTSFPIVDGQPIQRIAPSLQLELPLVDLSALSGREREGEAMRLAKEAGRHRFDLLRGPLLWAALLRLEAEEHILLLTVHHTVSDGWSMNVLRRELSVLYAAFVAGNPSPLPELPVQYADFAVCQREWLKGEVLQAHLAYWKQRLGGKLPILELPTDHPRPAIQTFRGAAQHLLLPRQLIEAIKALGASQDATLYMTLLAAFKVLLYRYTHQVDIVVGSPISGRDLPQVEGLIGLFLNTLVLRTELSDELRFRQLLQRVRDTVLGAFENQVIPFEGLLAELQAERSLSHSPLFQVAFVVQDPSPAHLELPGITSSFLRTEFETTESDLSLIVRETEMGPWASCRYRTDLFEPATIERLLGHFQILLEGIVADPEQKISQLPMLTAAERQQLLLEWNETQVEYPQDQCIYELFEAQVERAPGAVAVVHEDQRLTYLELNRRANQLAHYLRTLGVGPEVPVGICVERSLDMLVGILGILKAGGAYVPLDPSYPEKRLVFMIDDSQMPVLLTQERLLAFVPLRNARPVCLDTDWELIAQQSSTNPDRPPLAHNLAYVIYTSGSTGTPKGTLVEHKSLANHLHWVNHSLIGARELSLPLVSSLSFDACLKQLLAPLIRGSAVWILHDDAVHQPSKLLQALAEHSAVGLNCVPSLWELLLHTVESGSAPPPGDSLSHLFIGGEQFSEDLIARTLNILPSVEVWNLYGPTEATANATSARVDGKHPITIGRPITNCRVYLLDSSLEPVAVGIPGDLYIGGAGVARGYLNRPELTAEAFVPDPFSDEPGARLYKTGDLARYLPDGTIEFLGRLDYQIKIRGFRIELGEIEAVLSSHPEVREAVVLVTEYSRGDKRLLAYVVGDGDVAPEVGDLRDFLQERLPDYMVPAAFVMLDSLPLMPHGKVDRQALPAPDWARSELAPAFVAPRTPVEEVLAGIWAQVLRVERVGVHDNFFELGGHSLLATQVISRVRDAFQLDLHLAAIFEAPTITGLALAVEKAMADDARPPAPAITPAPRKWHGVKRAASGMQLYLMTPTGEREKDLMEPKVLVFPLSFSQQRLWFLEQLEPGSAVRTIPSAFHLSGPLNTKALEQSFNEVIRRHEMLRTTFSTVDEEPVQVIAPHLTLPLPVIDLTALPEQEQLPEARRLVREARRPFDLVQGPLLRATLLRLNQEEHVLALVLHHIISDGWSMEILYRELSTLYEAFSREEPSPLPDLPIQYADYAVWQRDWLQGDVLEAQLAYWRRQLEGAPPLLELPTDHPRPPVQTHQGAAQTLSLPTDLTQQLRALSQREGVTLFMTLLAAFKILLCRLSGQEDVVVGTPVAGHNRPEIEGVIGLFLNNLVLRTDLSGNPTFLELLGRVRETTLEAYDHQDVPFEKLLEELQPERDLSRTPLFQIFVNMYSVEAQTLPLSDLRVERFERGEAMSHFDLTAYILEVGEDIHLRFIYNVDLFDESTIQGMLRYYQNLLRQIVTQPQQTISNLRLLSKAERHWLASRSNAIGPTSHFSEFRAEEIEGTIVERFEKQVESYGASIAVKTRKYEWTYEKLNRQANQVARAILASDGQSEGRVGLIFEHDAPMLAAMVGALKAGKTYVPLDPYYPQERLGYILRESLSGAVLANNETIALALELHKGAAFRIINIDELNEASVDDNLHLPISPDTMAYILYTSGTTGEPKGVMQNHRNVLHHIRVYTNNLHIDAEDRLTLLSTYGFDAAVMDIYGALLNGASLYPLDLRAGEIATMATWMKESKISIYHSTPTVYRYFMRALAPRERLEKVRLVVLGGEPVFRADFERYKQHFTPESIFVNGFGPTESTLSTQFFLNHTSPIERNAIPIGYAVENTDILLVNEAGEDVEVYGEIAIRSPHIALGYWQKPDVTEAAFLPDPDGGNNRIYRTGDTGRLLPQGEIEFIGRKDTQVKIRGFRVELGEIEAELVRHPSIKEAAAIVHEDESGDRRIAAFLVAQDEHAPGTKEIRSYLGTKLPDYMLPASIQYLQEMPITQTGKLDRRALPAPDESTTAAAQAFVAPRTPVEEVLAGIWAQVLRVERVGVHDNFFDLGGHSLLATRLIAEVRDAFELNLYLAAIFEAPTVARLAELVETTHWAAQGAAPLAESREGEREEGEL